MSVERFNISYLTKLRIGEALTLANQQKWMLVRALALAS